MTLRQDNGTCRTIARPYLFELDDVRVVKLLEGLDLAKVHHLVPGVVLPFHGLYGHLLPGLNVRRHVH